MVTRHGLLIIAAAFGAWWWLWPAFALIYITGCRVPYQPDPALFNFALSPHEIMVVTGIVPVLLLLQLLLQLNERRRAKGVTACFDLCICCARFTREIIHFIYILAHVVYRKP